MLSAALIYPPPTMPTWLLPESPTLVVLWRPCGVGEMTTGLVIT
jgi:hypothetical protein